MDGYLVTVVALLDRGVTIESRDGYGRTPLALAVLAQRPGCVEILLERDTDTKARMDNGYTHLHIAARCGFMSQCGFC
jgi:ankyrin repeat protein